jgi:hypothetical protein
LKENNPTTKRTVHKVPLITETDAKEYEAIKARLIAELKKLGSYEPEVDDLQVDEIARATIQMRNTEKLLDTGTANGETYSRVTDSETKLRKIVEAALRELAITRRERMASKAQTAEQEELVKRILEELKNRPK